MIKVNLLNSVTDRAKGVAAVEDRVANPRAQTIILGLVVAALLSIAMAYDFVSAKAENASAKTELEQQQAISAQMALVNKEQTDLENKTKEVQTRIDAIQKLRAAQQGPGQVLREVKERIDEIPGLYLESVEQKGADLTIKGGSPNEAAVTRFGQSLEFSSGRFSNLYIETIRKKLESSGGKSAATAASADAVLEAPEMVNFVIKCNYSAPKEESHAVSPTAPAANQIAQR
jgi:Tfp pilus assembly protein PilN